MNIQEAIKSGKRYRRKGRGELDWYDPDYRDYVFCMRAILAEDWEVESKPVTITREQFDAAWRRALDVCENMEITTQRYLYEIVVRELGL